MKNINIFKFLSLAALTVGMSACSDNYLNVNPTTDVGQPEVTATVDNAQMAINGICNSMQTQYSGTDYNQYNGESYINTWLGEGMGPDNVVGLSISSFGADNLLMKTISNQGYVSVYLPWQYCYNLITQANVVIAGIDNASGDEEQRNFVKAEALTFRAFGYTKLLQYYAPRWEDSNNGEAYCVVLRLEPGTDPMPLAKMKDVLAQIYSDLDEATALFDGSSYRREYKWQPDGSVAYGVYARAALIKHDWEKAQKMAHSAREGYTIMDNDTYLSGFYADNNDFMWEQATNESDIYYWSWGSHFATNGIYVQNWNEGAMAISFDLARQLDPKDIRLQCFITPDKIDLMNDLGLNRGKVKESYFFDSELVSGDQLTMNTGYVNSLNQTSKRRYGLYNFALNYIVHYYANIYKGEQSVLENEGFFPYYTITDGGATGAVIEGMKDSEGKNVRGTLVVCPLGAQLKFVSIPPYGTSAYPFMRASEMCLAEAEAAYMAGDMTTARNCLNEINKMRVPGFDAANYSGQALLDQIRLCRRIELWGEGYSWTDWKRWNLDLPHNEWKANDVTSGNWPVKMADDIPAAPSVANSFWRMNVPTSESDYNNLIDRSLLPF